MGARQDYCHLAMGNNHHVPSESIVHVLAHTDAFYDCDRAGRILGQTDTHIPIFFTIAHPTQNGRNALTANLVSCHHLGCHTIAHARHGSPSCYCHDWLGNVDVVKQPTEADLTA